MTNNPAADWLDDVLRRIPARRVAVFGDFCLDAYWMIDTDESELSVESGLPVRRVREQRYGLGGAGNVGANLAALGVGSVTAVGLIGDDPFGRQLLELLADIGVDAKGVVACQPDWQTPVYAKPRIGSRETNRIDFGGFNRIAPSSVDRMVELLSQTAETSDAMILNQQLPAGVSTAAMIERINGVIAAHTDCTFIVDSRHRGELYQRAALKVNSHESARICGRQIPVDQAVSDEETRRFAERLREQRGKPVFITCGESGIIVAHEGGVDAAAGIRVDGMIDTVGAGDTVAAALAAALAVDADVLTAARLANVAASVTIRKLGTTGVASPAEMRAAARKAGTT